MKKTLYILLALVLALGIIGCKNINSYGDKETKPKAIKSMELKKENSYVSKAVSPSPEGKEPLLSKGLTLPEKAAVTSEDLPASNETGKSSSLEKKKSDSKLDNGLFTIIKPQNVPIEKPKSDFWKDVLKYYSILLMLIAIGGVSYYLWKSKTIKNPFIIQEEKKETALAPEVSPPEPKQLELKL